MLRYLAKVYSRFIIVQRHIMQQCPHTGSKGPSLEQVGSQIDLHVGGELLLSEM